jgi:hypothetical protein
MFEKFVENDCKKESEMKEKTTEQLSQMHTGDVVMSDGTRESKDYTNPENLKELIYKTYARSVDNSKALQKKEKKHMKKIMNLLIYLQIKKIELKLNYFNDFEKLIQFETQQIKSMESQVVQDRIKLAIKKCEIMNLSKKVKDISKLQEANVKSEVNNLPESSNLLKFDHEIKILDLN